MRSYILNCNYSWRSKQEIVHCLATQKLLLGLLLIYKALVNDVLTSVNIIS